MMYVLRCIYGWLGLVGILVGGVVLDNVVGVCLFMDLRFHSFFIMLVLVIIVDEYVLDLFYF